MLHRFHVTLIPRSRVGSTPASLFAVLQQAQRLLQLEGEAHFFEACRRRLKSLARLSRPAAFALAFAKRNMRSREVWPVAVGREEFETLGELLRRFSEGFLMRKEEATDTVSYAARRKPR